MGSIRKSITFTKQQGPRIKLKITSDDFTNGSEYIRDLVRKDQEGNRQMGALQSAIAESLNSGVSEFNVLDIMNRAEQTMKENGEL